MMTAGSIAALPFFLMCAAHALAQVSAAPDSASDVGRPVATAAAPTDPNADGRILQNQAVTDSATHVSFSPYLWITNFSGDVSVRGIQFDISRRYVDIWKNTDTAVGLMGALDIDYKEFVFQLNGSWVTAKWDKHRGIFQNGTVDANVDLDTKWIESFAGYRFLDGPLNAAPDTQSRFKIDGFAGGRVTSVQINTTLYASTNITLPGGEVLSPGQSAERNQSSDWIEPFIGLRTILDLDEHWLIQLRGDLGGFGVDGSQFAWQTAAVASYQWRFDGWQLGVFAGYRALGQDHTSGNLNWNVVTHGPLLGASLSFSF